MDHLKQTLPVTIKGARETWSRLIKKRVEWTDRCKGKLRDK